MSQWVELVYSRGGRERGREGEGVMGYVHVTCVVVISLRGGL